MAQQGFLLSIVLGVGGFMGPRLLGRDLLPAALASAPPEALRQWRARRVRIHLLVAAALIGSYWLEGWGLVRWAYACRALVVVGELWWTVELHRLPRATDLYARLLWVSFWLLAIGYGCVPVWPRYRIELLHVAFLGGYGLMTFAVATMVVYSHAGQVHRLRAPMPLLWIVASAVGAALVLRLAATVWREGYFLWLAFAAVAWMVAAGAWLALVAPWLGRVPEGDAIERLHAEARQRLLRA